MEALPKSVLHKPITSLLRVIQRLMEEVAEEGGLYKLRYSFSVVLQSQDHADEVEDDIVSKLRAMQRDGGRIQELDLCFSSRESRDSLKDVCIGTGWLTPEVCGTLSSITLSFDDCLSSFWDEDLWQRIDLCKSLTSVKVVGDYYNSRAHLQRLRLPLLRKCKLERVDRPTVEHILQEHTQLEHLRICGPLDQCDELNIDSSSLTKLQIDMYNGKLLLNTPNLKLLDLDMYPALENSVNSLVIFSAPKLEVLRISEHMDNFLEKTSSHENCIELINRYYRIIDAVLVADCPVTKMQFLGDTMCGVLRCLVDLLDLFPGLETIILPENVVDVEDMCLDSILDQAPRIQAFHFQRKIKVCLQSWCFASDKQPGAAERALNMLSSVFTNWTWELEQSPDQS